MKAASGSHLDAWYNFKGIEQEQAGRKKENPMPEQSKHLTHLDESGTVRMVDVTAKEMTLREALAKARIRMAPQTLHLIETNQIAKGNVLEVARIAAIMAAKQ